MNKISLYYHSGSKNHGCEAIVRSTLKILNMQNITLFSFAKKEDDFFGLYKIIETKQLGKDRSFSYKAKISGFVKKYFSKSVVNFLKNLRNKANKQITHDVIKLYPELFNDTSDICFSIGGDNYSYGKYSKLIEVNKKLSEQGKKTILWGCSIEPEYIEKDFALREDLNRYSLITARESITYGALIKNGINKNASLFPDPAFVLDKTIPNDLPKEFVSGNTVGVNLSFMVQAFEKDGNGNIVFRNFINLTKYILDNTNMKVCLIPHVTWDDTNDLVPLYSLYKKLKKSNRICLIDKPYNCMELKGIISQCRFMVAARTHASIAAYSTQVPTLVIGYSVKARGIARDIFGSEEGYVLPVQNLQRENEVVNAFKNIMQNEEKIRSHYKKFMPQYIEKAWQAKELIEKLL